ncbi:PIN domain-containing protein [Paenarthrobacter sp. NPDC090517]|uniref:PIN domain-containing protein n=1 Tax=Paenarthrobacter sp. NPDC090517 TaxID=3364381 RepID=UPI003812A8F8
MRDLFKGYYLPTQDEADAIWSDGLICLDANILLKLYDLRPSNASFLISELRKRQDQLWLPYQVALEFHRNSHSARAEQAESHVQRIKSVSGLLGQIRSTKKNSRFRSTDIQQAAVHHLEAWLEELKAERDDILTQTHHHRVDDLLSEISELFAGRVGPKPEKSDLEKVYKEGEARYKESVPPGYSDSKKPGNAKYGDLVLWSELMAHAGEQGRDVIFVTDDNKEDWWLKGRAPENISLAPRPELVQEFRAETNQDILILNSDFFFKQLTPAGTDQKLNEQAAAAQEDLQEAVLEEQADHLVSEWASHSGKDGHWRLLRDPELPQQYRSYFRAPYLNGTPDVIRGYAEAALGAIGKLHVPGAVWPQSLIDHVDKGEELLQEDDLVGLHNWNIRSQHIVSTIRSNEPQA